MNPQVANTLIGLGFVFVIVMLVLAVYVVRMVVNDGSVPKPKTSPLPPPPPPTSEQDRERRMLAATIAAGIASNVGGGFHSTQIADDALRIANEIIAQSNNVVLPKQYKTTLDWLLTLPDGICERAIQYTSDEEKKKKKDSLYFAVRGAFVWAHTPEGHHYWSDIANGNFKTATDGNA